MAKLVLAMFTTLDGCVCHLDGSLEPPPFSAEVVEAWVNHNLREAAHLVYGRTCFEFNKDYWTSPAAAGQTETLTMNALRKTVFSHTLVGDIGWNAAVAHGTAPEVIGELKRKVRGGEIYCFGGAGMAHSLMAQGLVDEWFLMVTPRLLGQGKRLFEGALAPADLERVEARPLDVGSVILHYRRA